MRLSEILDAGCIKVPLVATDKQAAIFELVDVLSDHLNLANPQKLKDAVWQRELTRTTGIGHGIGIPHGKVDDCDRLWLAIGKPAEPIDFDAIDKQPVDLIILLISPEDQTGPHIQALAQISRLLTDHDLRDKLKVADSAQAVFQIITDYEAQLAS